MTEILSPYLIAAAAGWIVAQVGKYIIASIKGRRLNSLRQLYLSGSMPSAHSATVIALVTVIAFKDGIGTPLFALALTFAAVVMYDAMMVRRSSGEQGAALTAFMKEKKTKVALPRVAKGHTPFEVLGGVIVGLIVGLSVHAITL